MCYTNLGKETKADSSFAGLLRVCCKHRGKVNGAVENVMYNEDHVGDGHGQVPWQFTDVTH